jgi:hypothetical protein
MIEQKNNFNEADEVSDEDLSAASAFFDKLRRKQLSKAIFAEYTPCNPIPFLNGLKQGCKDEGTDYIQSDEAKRILFTILQQAYSVAFKIDSFDEFKRLKSTFKE